MSADGLYPAWLTRLLICFASRRPERLRPTGSRQRSTARSSAPRPVLFPVARWPSASNRCSSCRNTGSRSSTTRRMCSSTATCHATTSSSTKIAMLKASSTSAGQNWFRFSSRPCFRAFSRMNLLRIMGSTGRLATRSRWNRIAHSISSASGQRLPGKGASCWITSELFRVRMRRAGIGGLLPRAVLIFTEPWRRASGILP